MIGNLNHLRFRIWSDLGKGKVGYLEVDDELRCLANSIIANKFKSTDYRCLGYTIIHINDKINYVEVSSLGGFSIRLYVNDFRSFKAWTEDTDGNKGVSSDTKWRARRPGPEVTKLETHRLNVLHGSD